MKPTLCLAFLGLVAGPLCTPAQEAKPKPEATAAVNPEELVARIERTLDADLPEELEDETKLIALLKKRVETADKMMAEFREKFPTHGGRWRLAFLELQTREIREKTGLAPLKDARPATVVLGEIAAAPDADPDTRAQASNGRLQELMEDVMSSKMKLEAWEKELAAHERAFPTPEDAPMLAEMHLSLVEQMAKERLPALLEEMSKSANADVASNAKSRLVALKAMAALKSKPLELKFKAVDGTDVDLEQLRGKVVLVDFWATWCGPCMAELPKVVKTYEKLKDKGFTIIGISLDEDQDDLKRVTKEKKMTWPQFFNGKGWDNPYSQKWGIDSIPTMWLVNKKGMVVDLDAREDLEGKVAKLLAE